ncbi:alkanesulfonate monooxygenase SsuD/methylene tetrahydromethanopterin reductase-like flavin-dependent oxidoreductase (luciferase family) [Microbacterium terrae]|uniref:Nitrilotriacetate monooxygenase component A n=1 Tax=Microbacterium terrae TaxID=69369 RepID=A0A0M2HFA8_9MICO|nr:LLM class flavin-dependent oxidoreductase [Microbacterium terrae]KJL45333.1 Nitrilotriacetate monooxygenase component A [Microbacterium terrae]MBP1078418.1 alkanesulfonate monooxygenase SsuD/methylene tetrahydromethanopterin reductase-like flavin-dependent oxidoreductase (luciferase family) [Microbacterium terrae]GLJ99318.1 nitrilotriacetate monooxygenase [Microbacterium terrae]
MTETRQLHINVNILNAGVFGGSWRVPENDPLSAYTLEHYVGIARAAEAARLDAVFLADGPGLDPDLTHRPGNSFEPSVLLARLAAETRSIGLIGTFSSSYNDADELAVRLAGLDVASGGRVGWNVVTTAGSIVPRNFGRPGEPDHGARYERASAVTSRVIATWAGQAGAAPAPTSPQGRPVLVQAGASKDGIALAGEHAEVIFTAAQTIEEALANRRAVDEQAARFGRRPEQVAILPGLSTVIGSTESEALARRQLLAELVPLPYALGRLGAQLGFDLTAVDLDSPVPRDALPAPEDAGGSQTFYRLVLGIIDREQPTYRQLLRKLGGGAGHRIVVGTPEQIADDIETWHRAGAADGFNVMPDALPSGFDDFAQQVIPELQRRGLFRTEYTGSTLREHLGLPVQPPLLAAPPVLAGTW